MKTKKEGKQKANILLKIVIIAIFLALVAAVINLAPNYIRNEIKDKMNIIINNNDVTTSMKFDAFVDEKDIVYIATKDIANFFDEDIYYDNVYDQIITTSETKVAVLPIDKKEITVNGSTIKIYGSAIKKENEFYLPFSELNDIYNVEIKYNKESNILTVDSLNREQKKANASKDVSVKYKPTIFSKTIDKIEKGDSVIVIESKDNGWYKIRTKLGKIGYTKDITNVYSVREEIENKKQIEGKVSLVWDYYSEYATAPNRQGTKIDGVNVVSPAFANLEKSGSLNINIGETGKKYVEWAHENEYKVWAIVSNNSYKAPTSEVLNDYKKRADLINKIVTIQYTPVLL